MDQDELNKRINLQQQIALLESQAKSFLDSEALLRFNNIKLVDPEKALHLATFIVQAVHTGQLQTKLSDSEFKDLLIRLHEQKKEFRFMKR